jgi:hypothetical protein
LIALDTLQPLTQHEVATYLLVRSKRTSSPTKSTDTTFQPALSQLRALEFAAELAQYARWVEAEGGNFLPITSPISSKLISSLDRGCTNSQRNNLAKSP